MKDYISEGISKEYNRHRLSTDMEGSRSRVVGQLRSYADMIEERLRHPEAPEIDLVELLEEYPNEGETGANQNGANDEA